MCALERRRVCVYVWQLTEASGIKAIKAAIGAAHDVGLEAEAAEAAQHLALKERSGQQLAAS